MRCSTPSAATRRPSGRPRRTRLEAWTASTRRRALPRPRSVSRSYSSTTKGHEPGTFFVQFPEAGDSGRDSVSASCSACATTRSRSSSLQGERPDLFANYFRLDALDRRPRVQRSSGQSSTYNALDGPSQQMEIEPDLVDAVLDEVAAGAVDLGDRARRHAGDEDRPHRAPYLQLVMSRCGTSERGAGFGGPAAQRPSSSSAAPARSSRATSTVRSSALTAAERDIAAAIFKHLVDALRSKDRPAVLLTSSSPGSDQ